jgi:ubiquinone biosynthesis protein
MDQLAAAVSKHHHRINEIANVLGRYGFAEWASRGGPIPGVRVVRQLVDPDIATLSTGERLRGAAEQLGPTFVKFAQMLSLRPDLVGPAVAEELEKLQSARAPDAGDVAAGTVAAELGAPADELFASFDPNAIGSGSVAQVHQATMHDGTEVVVKVLHAGVERRVTEDLELMRAVAEFLEQQDRGIAPYRPAAVVAEFDNMMRGAIDLGQELRNLQRFGKNFGTEDDVVIPTPYPDLSTRRALTMSKLVGRALADRAALEADGWDVDQLVPRAVRIYLEMIFRDSVFHADPHPGNFLLLSGQRIGILDFGDIGYVTAERRAQLQDLVIAVGAHDVASLTDTILAMTTPPADVDVLKLRGDIDIWLHRYFLGDVVHLDVGAILHSWTVLVHDHHLMLPTDLALLFRVLLRLQGLGRGVGVEANLTELLTPYMEEMLKERADPKRVARQAARTARSWEHLTESLPEQVLAALEGLRRGELTLDFRARDLDEAVDRLVDGLLASACLLAASQLISRKAGPTVAGLSVAGLAAAGSAIVTWRRLALKRQSHKSFVEHARTIYTAAPRSKR